MCMFYTEQARPYYFAVGEFAPVRWEDAFFEMFRHAYFAGVWYKKARHTVGDAATFHPSR